MYGSRPRRGLTLVLVAASAVACETGTEPEGGSRFDAQAALADHQALEVLLESGTMGALRALGAAITDQEAALGAALVLTIGEALEGPGNPATARSLADLLFRASSAAGAGTFNNPIISLHRRGKTFSYDPGLGRYVIDEDREGAPATGVRFILYRPGPGGKPDPTAEVGYADLIDEGDDSAEEVALRLMVVVGSDTLLEYRTTLDVLDHGGRITVVGFLQGEVDRLDFQIEVSGSANGQKNTVDVSFEMGIASRDFLITGSASGMENESGEGGEIHLLVQHGGDSFQVDASGTSDSIDGSFNLNGEPFATVTGEPDDPIFRSANGSALTWVELLVLRRIIHSSKDVFGLWKNLLDPVDEILILALIL